MTERERIEQRCRKANACAGEYQKLLETKNLKGFYEVITRNIPWCLGKDIIQDWKQFGKHCDWSKLDGLDWSYLLRKQPQFAEHCEWSKLSGFDWSWLLQKQPEFAKYCDWSKLSGFHWSLLLWEQPQFEKYREE